MLLRKILFSIQVYLHNAADIVANPLPWSGLNKSIKYFTEIGPIVYVINSSANFIAYQCLVYKEKKLQKERKQEREMEMEMEFN